MTTSSEKLSFQEKIKYIQLCLNFNMLTGVIYFEKCPHGVDMEYQIRTTTKANNSNLNFYYYNL